MNAVAGMLTGVLLVLFAHFLYGFAKGLLGHRDQVGGQCDVCGTAIAGPGTALRFSMQGRPDVVVRRCPDHPVTPADVDEIRDRFRTDREGE